MTGMMKKTPLAQRMAAFRDDTRGTVTVEALVMLPLLLWAFCALFTFFDAYRQTSISHKAAYTLSDMLSRETSPVTNDYLDSAQELLGFLTRSDTERRMRVSVVRFDLDQNEHFIEWSQTRGAIGALDNATIGSWDARLPVMVDEERIILVETWTDYNAPFNVGLNGQTISTFVFTRPRFAPQLLFDGAA